MKKLFAAVLAAAVSTAFAQASFHLFDIQEVYTNADGSVQFVELFTAQGGQQFLNGHTLRFEINTAVQNTLNFSSLGSDSANKTVLIATANFSALFGITPDFIIPANFLTAGASNFINFAEGTDRVNLTNLPSSGVMSLNGMIANTAQTAAATSVNAQATPRNYAGQTVTIPEPAVGTLLAAFLGVAACGRRRRRRA